MRLKKILITLLLVSLSGSVYAGKWYKPWTYIMAKKYDDTPVLNDENCDCFEHAKKPPPQEEKKKKPKTSVAYSEITKPIKTSNGNWILPP